jgi:phosphate transport system substrate-binding protein
MKFAMKIGNTKVLRYAAVYAILTALLVIPLTACQNGSDAGMIVAGSTSVQPFAEILAEEYMILHPDCSIDIQGGGSSAGIMSAQSGTADIGMSSRSLKESEMSLWSVEIARDGLAVIVHSSNPIHNLTLSQIRDIYTAAITDWSQLGGRNSKIHVITREEGSGTRGAFEDLVMDDMRISPKSIVQDSNGAVRQLVADDANAIGFISLGLVDDTVQALQLEGVAATTENVINGSYGLSRPFIFMTLNQPSGETKEFIDFTLSAEGQKLLAADGLIPSADGAGR